MAVCRIGCAQLRVCAIAHAYCLHALYELRLIESGWQVALVAEHQDGNGSELRLVKQVVQLVARSLNLLVVSSVNHVAAATRQAFHPDVIRDRLTTKYTA